MTTPDTDPHAPEGVPTPPPPEPAWYQKALAFFNGLALRWRVVLLLLVLVLAVAVYLRLRSSIDGLLSIGQGPVTATAGTVVAQPDKVSFVDKNGKPAERRKSPDANVTLSPIAPGPGLPKGGTQVDPEEWGFVLDPLVGGTYGRSPILPAVGARVFFLGPDFGVAGLAELPTDLFTRTESRAGLVFGPDLRTGNIDLVAGAHLPYGRILDPMPPGFAFSISLFPFAPPGKTIVKNPPAP